MLIILDNSLMCNIMEQCYVFRSNVILLWLMVMYLGTIFSILIMY
jgi:hypothetical protein